MKKLFLLPLLTLLIGCAVNPVTGSKELVLIDERQEVAIGSEIFLKMQEQEGGRYTKNKEVSAYVQRVGEKLAAVSDRPNLPYEFVVLNNPIPNAWTLPGGKIAINTGLLSELESEAELAAVLSHEIVHAAARHGAQQLQSGLLIGTAAQIGAETIGRESEDLLNVGCQLVMLKYSRDKEFEADKYGIRYMAAAGYDVQAAVTLQEKFLALSQNENPNWLQGLFRTHPPSKERIKANRRTAKKYPPGGTTGQETYQKQVVKKLKKTNP